MFFVPARFLNRMASQALCLLLAGCGSSRTDSPPGQEPHSVAVDPLSCPKTTESSAGKLSHEAYLRAHPQETQRVTIRLRPLEWANPACSQTDASPSCADREQALAERQALNLKQVGCVLDALSPDGAREGLRAQWYEALPSSSGSPPTPIGTAFSVLALWRQLDVVSRHPYVERIEPAPGEAVKLGVSAPAIPSECPVATEPADAKLVDAASLRGNGRQAVVIELKETNLPALRPCASNELCDDWFASGWERTVASTRQTSCVRALLDTVVPADSPEVAYGSVDGILGGPPLPPFGEAIHATLAFGRGLTWEEASAVAKHPFVKRLWTSDGLSFGTLPEGCPLDYEGPVVLPDCPSSTEASSDKFTSAAAAKWQASSGEANEVVIAVRRDQQLCPPPACPGRGTTCPELERYHARVAEESQASQSCVRSLVSSIGGSASDEVLVLGNAFSATLTWEQIQTVAGHPDVIHIDPRFGDPPMP